MSITKAEHELYTTLLALSQNNANLRGWLSKLPEWIFAIKDKNRYAQAPYYASLIDKLPTLDVFRVDITSPNVRAYASLSPSDYKKTEALLKALMPWRKGGFVIGDDENFIHIDTEWRSDKKWDRVLPHITSLKKRCVLDVGGGSGYHGFRMAGEGADTVVIIDPSCLFYHQFMAIRHFVGALPNRFNLPAVHYIPTTLDELPVSQLFDTVFCMGVLYHRPSPFECLWQLKNQLRSGGELVLETLVVNGDENTVLVPTERYAKMNNVYFLPSVPALTRWLSKAGFMNIRCVDINVTTIQEQRATDWMNYESLADFISADGVATVEGYQLPTRATLIANKL